MEVLANELKKRISGVSIEKTGNEYAQNYLTLLVAGILQY
jgi:hypothetical protein